MLDDQGEEESAVETMPYTQIGGDLLTSPGISSSIRRSG